MIKKSPLYGFFGKAGQLQSATLRAATTFAKEMQRIAAERKPLADVLKKTIPRGVKEFFDEGMIIDTLLENGRYQTKALVGTYGFKSSKDLRAKFRELQKAWSGVIQFRLQSVQSIESHGQVLELIMFTI